MEHDPRFIFTKLAIDKVKEYAIEHKCSIEEACGSETGVSLPAYKEAIQFMIRTGYRYNIYNKVYIPWDYLNVSKNHEISIKYPRLYREITLPEISVQEHSSDGVVYCLSDTAYNEWCEYQKEGGRDN